jgi:hypothetical protein
MLTDVSLFGIAIFPFLINLLAHYIVYTLKIKDIYRDELLPEKRKIEYFINILKKRRIERQ